MSIRTLSVFTLATAFASTSFGADMQARLEQEMATIRAMQRDPVDTRDCMYSQKNHAVLSCPFGKIEKQRLSSALSAAGWTYAGSKELFTWFFHAGETLEFRKDILLLSLDFYDSDTQSNVESLSTK